MLDLTLLVKELESGQFEASVLELPAYRVEAKSRELAIDSLKATLLEQVQDAEALAWRLPVNQSEKEPSWLKFAGMFKDNADFTEIVEEIRATRNVCGDEMMDESEYIR